MTEELMILEFAGLLFAVLLVVDALASLWGYATRRGRLYARRSVAYPNSDSGKRIHGV